jgi:hypothetical protein
MHEFGMHQEAVAIDELADKLGSGLSIAVGDRICFDPLPKLVECNKQMGVASWSALELSDHIESPDREWPVDGDRLQCRAWNMRLVGLFLAPDATSNDVDCVGVGGEQVEAQWRMALATSEHALTWWPQSPM